jgi:hypothetical protein
VLAFQAQAGRVGLYLEQGGEVGLAVPAAHEALHQLVNQRGDRHWRFLVARGGQAKVEVLAQQPRGERGLEVKIDVGRCLIGREQGPHHAFIEAAQEVLPPYPALFGQHRYLGERLRHHAEEQVVAELDRAGQFSFAHVGRPRSEQVQVGGDHVEGGPGA